MGNVSKELKGIEDIYPSSQSGTFFKRIKGHWRCLSLIPVWDIEKENCLHQKSLWNWQCHIHMKYGDITFSLKWFLWVAKKYWRPYFLFSLLSASLKSTWVFYFWDIFLGIHSIWMLLLLLWMQLWLNMLRFVCELAHFLISWTLMK